MLGLPTGQHVAIGGYWNDESGTRPSRAHTHQSPIIAILAASSLSFGFILTAS